MFACFYTVKMQQMQKMYMHFAGLEAAVQVSYKVVSCTNQEANVSSTRLVMSDSEVKKKQQRQVDPDNRVALLC